MFKLFRYFKWYYWLIFGAIIGLIYLQVSLDLELPDKMREIITLVDTLAGPEKIWSVGYEMLLITLASVVCTVIVGFLAAYVAAGFARILRLKVYEKVDAFSLEEINNFSTASLITRTTNDVQQVQMTTMMFMRMAVTAPIMAYRAINKIFTVNSQMTLTVGIGVFAIVALITTLFFIATPKFKKIQENTDDLNLVTRENLTGIRVVRAHNAEAHQEEKFEIVNETITKTNLFVNRTMSLMWPGMGLIMSGLNLAIVWLGAYLISIGQLGRSPVEGIGLMMAFITYSMLIIMSFMMITMMFIMYPRASVSGKRINEVLNTKIMIHDPIMPTPKTELTGMIEFRNVSFKYPNATLYVLENISFIAKPNETVAFIGSTGSGKSTLINLIPRFFDATSGEILINGINIKDYKQQDLRQLIGYVPQQGVLFTGSVESNLKLGNENANSFEIEEALDIAQAKDFVMQLEGGLNAPISRGGKNLSGGQKQRLSIARAIIKKPQIFIFDDSFSALDYRTDRELRKALKVKTTNATNLIVAQRIGTILHADKIVVLNEGKIVGIGTHKELFANCEVYREMAYSQLSKEELAHVN